MDLHIYQLCVCVLVCAGVVYALYVQIYVEARGKC